MSIYYNTVVFGGIFNFPKNKKISQVILFDFNRTNLDINNESVNEKVNHLKIKIALHTLGTKCKSKFLLE